MRKLSLCVGILFAVVANAELAARATLVGQHMHFSAGGAAVLVCEYSGQRTRYEIVSPRGSCARFIEVQ